MALKVLRMGSKMDLQGCLLNLCKEQKKVDCLASF
jgi:hypothetical protein